MRIVISALGSSSRVGLSWRAVILGVVHFARQPAKGGAHVIGAIILQSHLRYSANPVVDRWHILAQKSTSVGLALGSLL